MFVLIVEDNAALAANIGDYLVAQGDEVDFAYDGPGALSRLAAQTYDVLVLDVALPRMDGLAVCAALREGGNEVPVLMLTARDTLDDKLAGFEVGTDDYLTKPFDLVELRARLQALMRRGRARSRQLVVGDLRLDTATMTVERDGAPVRVTPTGLRLLVTLMQRAPALVTREELERAAWGDQPPDGTTNLRVHVHALRAAIDAGHAIKLLRTVPGFGYRLAAECDEAP